MNQPNYRHFYEKIQITSSLFAGVISYIALGLGLWQPPEAIIPKTLMFFAVPLVLVSLYLTSVKKIFSQRIGDIIHACIAILITSNFNLFYGGGIGSYFVFLFFLLIILFTLLLDDFIPLFISILVSLIVVGEFFLTADLARLPYIPLVGICLQVVAFLVVGWASSNLVKRTLAEQKNSRELKELTKTLDQRVQERTKELRKSKEELQRVYEQTKLSKEELQESYEEIQERKEELERFYSLTVGRELKMIELKKKIKEIEGKTEK